MPDQIVIQASAAEAAQQRVESLGTEYETTLAYPVVSLSNAQPAADGRDDLKLVWDKRKEDELDGVDGIALAIGAIAQSYGAADSAFGDALNDLRVARNHVKNGR